MDNRFLSHKYWSWPWTSADNAQLQRYIEDQVNKKLTEKVLEQISISVPYFLANNSKLNQILAEHATKLSADLKKLADATVSEFIQNKQDQLINDELWTAVNKRCDDAIISLAAENHERIDKISKMANISVLFSAASLAIIVTGGMALFIKSRLPYSL